MRASRNPFFNPPAEVRPLTLVPTPTQLVKQVPHISEDAFFSYHDTHQALLTELARYDDAPSARRGFWGLERRLQKMWNKIDPPPPYCDVPPPYKP